MLPRFCRSTERSGHAKSFPFKDLARACKKIELCTFRLTLEREDSARDVCAEIHHGIGARSGPCAGTSGKRTSRRRDPCSSGDHSSGRRSSPSTGGACGGTRPLRHSRDSVRPLPTFLPKAPSPLYIWRTRTREDRRPTPNSLRTSGGRHGTTSFQLDCLRRKCEH